jgi:hypothetical protein
MLTSKPHRHANPRTAVLVRPTSPPIIAGDAFEIVAVNNHTHRPPPTRRHLALPLQGLRSLAALLPVGHEAVDLYSP